MRKFILKLLPFIFILTFLYVILPYTVDPYNIFHTLNMRDNGVEPNTNYLKMDYILNNPDKYDSFLFGSSRVGAIHVDKIPSDTCYNMTYSIGLPSEHLQNIQTFLANGICPKKIYIGVDNISYTYLEKDHHKQPLRMPYEYAKANPKAFLAMYFNPTLALESLKIITHHTPESTNDFYNYGWRIKYDAICYTDWNQNQPPSIGGLTDLDEKMVDALNTIKQIKTLCDNNNIEVFFFTNPMHHITYKASVDANYYDFLEQLATITDFYNFSGLNAITTNDDNYLDTSHYKASIGDMIINVMCNNETYPDLEKEGFGIYTTKENVHMLIDILEKADK